MDYERPDKPLCPYCFQDIKPPNLYVRGVFHGTLISAMAYANYWLFKYWFF